MRKPPSLILVADGNHARLISHTSRRNAVLWRMASGAAAAKDFDLVTDRPGRSFDRAGQGRHAMEPGTSPRRAAQMRFARKVATRLKQSLDDEDFARVVLVAAPRTLGDLRRELPDGVSHLITDELGKDLAGLDDEDVLDHLVASDIRV